MGKKGLYRKILASIIAAMVLFGTTGFIFEEHRCTHCGTDYTVRFLNNGASQNDSCSNIPAKSCCSEDADVDSEYNQEESCTLDGQSCCSYKTESINISDPVQISSTEIAFISGNQFRYLFNFNNNAQNTGHIIFRSFYNHPPARQTLTLISQFLT